jgi:hypothetical protein
MYKVVLASKARKFFEDASEALQRRWTGVSMN